MKKIAVLCLIVFATIVTGCGDNLHPPKRPHTGLIGMR